MKKILPALLALMISLNINAQVNLNNGLLVYLPLNNSLTDLSGNNNHGVGHGGVSYGPDDFGNANASAFFDGVDDWVSVADTNDITLGHTATIAFKFKTTSTAMQDIINKANYSNADNIQFEVEIYASSIHPSDNLFFGTDHNNSCSSVVLASNYLYSDSLSQMGKWYCVIMTFNNGVKRLYVNGTLRGQQTVTGTTNNNSIDSCSSELKLGVWWSGDLNHFSGNIDEVRLYKRVLNTQELDSVCNYNSVQALAVENVKTTQTEFEVYPNPVNGNSLSISGVDVNGNATISVVNQLGQTVLYRKLMRNNTLDISGLPTGVYVAELNTGQVRHYRKFVKQ